MTTTNIAAGFGDPATWGACYGDPLDPRTEEMDDETAALWFAAEEAERLSRDMKAALRGGEKDRAKEVYDDLCSFCSPLN